MWMALAMTENTIHNRSNWFLATNSKRFELKSNSSKMKYILVTGGVISGIGKGVLSSSIGALLKNMGFRVTAIKIDPYINIDASLFSPYEHGEVFVLDDGGEVDLDLGNYERFLDIKLNSDNNITTGKIYKNVIEKERRGDYLGKTVQIIPHVTNEIQDWIERVAQMSVDNDNPNEIPEICVIELGGTIGDIEGMPFVEAFRQFSRRMGPNNFCCVHVSLVPKPKSTGEHKTKPTQVSVKELRALGLWPDLIICRSETTIDESVKEKISNYCHVDPKQVICLSDQSSIYRVPLVLVEQGLVDFFTSKFLLNVPAIPASDFLHKWRLLADKHDSLTKQVTIALVGKYTKLEDSYASVIKALNHASLAINRRLKIFYIEGSSLEDSTKKSNSTEYYEAWHQVCQSDGIIVPGGFGLRGIEGKILAIEHARTNKKPFLGVCLGFQCAVIEFCRNVLKMSNADSQENSNSPDSVIIEMPEHNGGNLGGTMRVGSRETKFIHNDCLIYQLYDPEEDTIHERHRHRYEVNPSIADTLHQKGFRFVAVDTTQKRMEIMELQDHPYFVGVQFHPEYTSRPLKPSPPYLGLLLASSNKLDSYINKKFIKSIGNTSDTESNLDYNKTSP
ncbi:CTP synthase 1-like protein [Sarcoptes scabiei]|nr:CTP synthase 1-like protein [Sarcoptes scabiei]